MGVPRPLTPPKSEVKMRTHRQKSILAVTKQTDQTSNTSFLGAQRQLEAQIWIANRLGIKVSGVLILGTTETLIGLLSKASGEVMQTH